MYEMHRAQTSPGSEIFDTCLACVACMERGDLGCCIIRITCFCFRELICKL